MEHGSKEDGKTYHALVECSLNGQFLQYVWKQDYPGIVDDLRATYKKARTLPVDVFLSSHASFYGLARSTQAGDARPRRSESVRRPRRATRLTWTSSRRRLKLRWPSNSQRPREGRAK